MATITGFAPIDEVLAQSYAGNTVESYLYAVGAFLAILFFIMIFKHVLIGSLKKASKKTKNNVDDYFIGIVDGVGWPVYIMLAIHFCRQLLILPEIVGTVIYYALVLVIAFYAIRIAQSVIDVSSKHLVERRRREGGQVDTTILEVFKKLLKVIMWVCVLLFIASSAGFDISNIFVGIGVTGIVLGFALQNVLADIFAAFSIFFDKPFEKGDFIVIGTDSGTVEKIGIRSTRIRHLQGQELIVSNRELTSIRINNFKKLKKRRVSFNVAVAFGTSPKKLEMIPKIVKGIFDKIELAELDRVHFKELGTSSFVYEVVYFVNTSDYNKHMDVLQDVNMAIVKTFQKEKISFANLQPIFYGR